MTAPCVSVVLPTYNRAPTLPRAIHSVLAQGFRELELIVVDDGSSDDSEAVVRAIADPRVVYLRRDKCSGAAAARNVGLAAARGELIAFQDSDDEWLPGKLEQQVERLDALPAEFALTQGAVQFEGLSAQYLFSDLPAGEERTAILACNNTTFMQAWLARKAALLAVGGFDERLHQWEDWELLIRICQRYRVDFDPRVMAVIHDTPGSLIKQHHRRVQSLSTIVDKHRALMDAHPRAMALNLYGIARFKLIASEDRDARTHLLRSLRLDPTQLRAWALLLASLLGRPAVRKVVDWREARRQRAMGKT
ncbi:MAG TPA: glycosyltransferase family A protein [Nevskiaceae bacterium]|nr:glycosyltransferase family A protein [Nevskiaceae bacterium]